MMLLCAGFTAFLFAAYPCVCVCVCVREREREREIAVYTMLSLRAVKLY